MVQHITEPCQRHENPLILERKRPAQTSPTQAVDDLGVRSHVGIVVAVNQSVIDTSQKWKHRGQRNTRANRNNANKPFDLACRQATPLGSIVLGAWLQRIHPWHQ